MNLLNRKTTSLNTAPIATALIRRNRKPPGPNDHPASGPQGVLIPIRKKPTNDNFENATSVSPASRLHLSINHPLCVSRSAQRSGGLRE